jgi:chaperone BCS1
MKVTSCIIASQEGRVVMMTTNHVDTLDEALIRPGRVDLRGELGLADKSALSRMFYYAYEQTELGEGDVDGSSIKERAAQSQQGCLSQRSAKQRYFHIYCPIEIDLMRLCCNARHG